MHMRMVIRTRVFAIASRVCAGTSERQRLGDAPTTLDAMGYKLPSPFGEEMLRTSMHVVQVLVRLAVDEQW
jgi:hypothetical protein